jgi:ubiquinone/menaquinone biosynthesis C-methylase UbiE
MVNFSKEQTKEQKVARHFDEIIEVYVDNHTNGSPFAYYFKQRLKVVLRFLKNYSKATVLDLGCGPGMMVNYCVDKDFEFFGVDISERMIDECIKKFEHINTAHFSVGKLQHLNFSDSSFDIILCLGALEYLNENDCDIALSEMIRVLKPGGLIILSLLNEKSFYWRYGTLSNMVRAIFNKPTQPKPEVEALHRTFEENSFRTALQIHQLTDIDTIFFGLNLFGLEGGLIPNKIASFIKKGLESILGNQLKWLCMAFVIKAQKN